MENKFRNEVEISLGGEKILLRPTFENIAKTESNVGSISYLAWKFSRGVSLDDKGKVDPQSLSSEAAVKSLPSLSEATQIIFYNQAEPKFSIEDIWDLVLKTPDKKGLMMNTTVFIGRMLTGGNFDEEKEVTEDEKKS